MSRDKKLGIGLSAISLLAVILAVIYLVFTGDRMPLAGFAWPALGFFLGLALIFFGFVETGLQVGDEIEQFPELIEDDISDLRSGTITPTHLFVAITLIAAFMEFWLLLRYRKVEASWGPINVLLAALIVVVVTLFLSLRSDWFQFRRHRLAPTYFIVPTIGWLICCTIGVLYAEPAEYGGRSQMDRTQTVELEGSQRSPGPGANYALFRAGDMAGDVLFNLDCDDEGCLLVLLIVVVAVSVLASAAIPHFWVVATLLLLTLMALITLRELLYSDDFD